jgi:hypothetical protein
MKIKNEIMFEVNKKNLWRWKKEWKNKLRKESERGKKLKNKDMKKKEEMELKKVILMTIIETKTCGNEDKRKRKTKNKRMLDGN